MSDPDHQLLTFAAAHRIVLASQLQTLLHENSQPFEQRLARLLSTGLLTHHRAFHGQPGLLQITARGLAEIGSPLPVPRAETVHDHRREIAIGWLHIAAKAGTFGEAEDILTQRLLRAHDQAHGAETSHESPGPGSAPRERDQPPFGVRVHDGSGDAGSRHYPDLMLIIQQGRIAIELQLHHPAPRRLSATIAAYGADPHIKVALYLTDNPKVSSTIRDTAARLGLSNPTHVQRLRQDPNTLVAIAQ